MGAPWRYDLGQLRSPHPFNRYLDTEQCWNCGQRESDPMHLHTTTPKGHPMNRTIAQINQDRDAVHVRLDRAIRKRQKWATRETEERRLLVALDREFRLAQYPPEPTESTVRFEKRYATSAKTYSFGAIRAEGVWWVTGRQSPQGLTWNALVDFMRKDNVLPMPTFQPLVEDSAPF